MGNSKKVKMLKKIDKLFEKKLQQKTGWGRNEVLKEYRASVNEILIKMIDD